MKNNDSNLNSQVNEENNVKQVKKNNNKIIGIVVLVIGLLLLGFAGYKLFIENIETDNPNNNTQNQDNNQKDNTYYDLTNIECLYSSSDSSNETFGVDCDKYNPRLLYDKYKLSNNHTIEKMIFANDKLVYLVMSNIHGEYSNVNYHEYLYSIEKNESYFMNDSYKRIVGVYNEDNKAKVILYNEVDYGEKYNFKTIGLSDNIIYTEASLDVEGFTNPIIVSMNNKNYIILSLASEFPDQLILTIDFNKIDIGLAYDAYDFMDNGNIKIYVGSDVYKIYDEKGNKISEGKY